MQIDAAENALFSVAVNPLLKSLISRFSKECPRDSSLLLNSLKDFLGAPVSLCPTCQRISYKIAALSTSLEAAFYEWMRDS